MQRYELNIGGMSCQHCVKAVREALAELPEVQLESVEVGRAVVSLEPPAALERVRARLDEEGYPLLSSPEA